MAVTPEEAKLRRRAQLSYQDIKRNNPAWDDIQVDDYLDKQNEINILVEESNTLAEQVAENTATNETQQTEIDSNTAGVSNNAATNATQQTEIDANTSTNATQQTEIDANTAGVATNAGNITTVTNNFNAHDASNSEHGVTGDNVGTGDFAQTAIGRVVLLADLVADVAATTAVIAIPDVGPAPVAYDQAYADEQTDLINECKAKINSLINNDVLDLITQFNDLLQQMKDANQMSST